jgi:Fur family ferric uptake transcriptional regulator
LTTEVRWDSCSALRCLCKYEVGKSRFPRSSSGWTTFMASPFLPIFVSLMESTESILTGHQLRITASRKAVLDAFIHHPHALSQPDLEKMLPQKCDRVTIYRILDSFLKKGILHKVPDNEGKQKYALCESCTDHHHHDEHLHFKCTRCGKTECLDDIPMPSITLPQGYRIEEWHLLLQGLCKECA